VHAEVHFQNDRTHEAVGQVLTNVSRNSIILRQELESVLLRDINNLDAPALRIRITQLVAELFERLSWESIRISQSVVQVEKEITEKYALMMQQQRKELEFEIEKILFAREKDFQLLLATRSQELETKYQSELSATVKSQAEGFQATLNKELEAQATKITTELIEQFNNHLANLHKQHQDHLLAVLPKVESLSAEVSTYHQIIDSTQRVIDQTVQLHDISTALLGLELLLTNQNNTLSSTAGQSISSKLQELKTLSNSDTLISAIIDTIPQHVKDQGVLSANELLIRFQILHDEIRKVALAPQSPPPMIGQAIGSVLASISLKPKGNIQGSGIEETMARAYYQLERGKLPECLKELQEIQGYSKVLLKDWQELANDRLVVDQAILALKAESLVRHKSFRS
jgi:mitofilin